MDTRSSREVSLVPKLKRLQVSMERCGFCDPTRLNETSVNDKMDDAEPAPTVDSQDVVEGSKSNDENELDVSMTTTSNKKKRKVKQTPQEDGAVKHSETLHPLGIQNTLAKGDYPSPRSRAPYFETPTLQASNALEIATDSQSALHALDCYESPSWSDLRHANTPTSCHSLNSNIADAIDSSLPCGERARLRYSEFCVAYSD